MGKTERAPQASLQLDSLICPLVSLGLPPCWLFAMDSSLLLGEPDKSHNFLFVLKSPLQRSIVLSPCDSWHGHEGENIPAVHMDVYSFVPSPV